MKKITTLATLMVAIGSAAGAARAADADVLTGDTRLACEAVLCLSTGTRPSECAPSLSRYFGISKKKFSDTVRARSDFLQLCPASNQTPEMQSLVAAISRGAGQCDAQALNGILRQQHGRYETGITITIGNRMPDYCAAYTGHAYTDFASSGTLPRYVGTPERGGYWVESRNYDRALAEYNERIRREDAERRQQSWYNRGNR